MFFKISVNNLYLKFPRPEVLTLPSLLVDVFPSLGPLKDLLELIKIGFFIDICRRRGYQD